MSQYIHFGIFLITVPNLIVIGLMVVAFVIATAVRLPAENPLEGTTTSTEKTEERR